MGRRKQIQKLGSHKKCKPVMSKTSLKKINRKRKNMIEKMFNKLRNESAIEDASIIEIDDSRHKLSSFHSNSNLQSTNETLNDTLIILDGDSHIETPQNKCSTPNTSLFKSMVDPNTSIIQNIDDDDDDDDLHESIKCLTQEIHSSNFITIDLTTETTFKTADNTVIDLDNDQAEDGAGVSTSNTSISISGESDVTVLNINSYKKRKANKMKKFTDGVANLNAVEKGKLLEMITQTIFNGCDISNANLSIRKAISKCIETQEDTFIKEVILGQKPSRNSIGSNIYNPDKEIKAKSGLRMIIIDGSNVAMEHGRGRSFSVRGLKICVDYFTKRGHIVKAFVPRFRCKFGKSSDPRALDAMERAGLVVYTPSREIQGRMVTSYDDRYIVQCAAEFDGVIVSGDNYRDLLQENQRWRFVIENRLLPFTWVNDMLMFPKDPLGRNGPTLERFLRHD